jgi:hypothetical protein
MSQIETIFPNILNTDGTPGCYIAETILKEHGLSFVRAFRSRDFTKSADESIYPILEVKSRRTGKLIELLEGLDSIKNRFPQRAREELSV